ncbi:MAG: acetylglutamate kinase [Gemmatimonadetes bacterium]|nr:acetylglutamate kinase [Gemmatimonadota bacterium]
MLTVVKVGGAAARDPAAVAELARSVASVAGASVVVHGGGPEISAWQDRLGLPVAWSEGLRITSPEAMQVTAMVLSGWINKRLVAALMDAGAGAVGVSGEDGGLLSAAHMDGGRLGEVGHVVEVRPALLRALLSSGFLPVVSPVSRGPGGRPLNVNADEAAACLAASLGARRLLLVSDVPGVVVDGVPEASLSPERAADLVDRGVIGGGMAVKVRQALVAAAEGVEVCIGDERILDDPAAGTRILAASAETAGRPA